MLIIYNYMLEIYHNKIYNASKKFVKKIRGKIIQAIF